MGHDVERNEFEVAEGDVVRHRLLLLDMLCTAADVDSKKLSNFCKNAIKLPLKFGPKLTS